MLALLRSHLRFSELVQRCAWAHPAYGIATQITGETGLLYRAGDIETHPGPQPTLPSRGRGVLTRDILPTTAQHDDVAVSDFEHTCELRALMERKDLSATVSMTLTTQICVQ